MQERASPTKHRSSNLARKAVVTTAVAMLILMMPQGSQAGYCYSWSTYTGWAGWQDAYNHCPAGYFNQGCGWGCDPAWPGKYYFHPRLKTSNRRFFRLLCVRHRMGIPSRVPVWIIQRCWLNWLFLDSRWLPGRAEVVDPATMSPRLVQYWRLWRMHYLSRR